MDCKKQLARAIVGEFHSPAEAEAAQLEFERVFSARSLPQDIPDVVIETDSPTVLVAKALVQAGLAQSNSEARRLMTQGGVKIEGEAVRDIKATLGDASSPTLVQVGKRKFARITLQQG